MNIFQQTVTVGDQYARAASDAMRANSKSEKKNLRLARAAFAANQTTPNDLGGYSPEAADSRRKARAEVETISPLEPSERFARLVMAFREPQFAPAKTQGRLRRGRARLHHKRIIGSRHWQRGDL